MRASVLGLGLVLVLCHQTLAVPKHDVLAKECSCATRALPGFKDARCECMDKQPGMMDRLGLSGFVSVSHQTTVAPQTNNTCVCEVSTHKGYTDPSCACDSVFVPCPLHSHTHPNCDPDIGYRGRVYWDEATQSWIVKNVTNVAMDEIELVPCGERGMGEPFCVCKPGYSGSFTWDFDLLKWHDNCTAVPCRPNASGSPNCHCSYGYKESVPMIFHTGNASYTGECQKVNCPSNTISSTHPVCGCVRGFKGTPKMDPVTGVYSNCSIADCIPHASHNDQSLCVCDKGFVQSNADPLNFNFDQQQWLGLCDRVLCPAGATGHPHCSCQEGYFGTVTWNETSRTYQGSCAERACPAGGLLGQRCKCTDGLISSPTLPTWNYTTQQWTHTCTQTSCPEGSSSADSTKCRCDLPGYIADPPLSWTGTTWGVCKDVACPTNTIADNMANGTRACSCKPGFSGQVTWNSEVNTWISTCAPEPCPPHAECSDEATGVCLKGYAGTVTWHQVAHQWISRCAKVECPVGAFSHPDCRCSVGYSGGAYATHELLWAEDKENPTNSKYQGICVEWDSTTSTLATCYGKYLTLQCAVGKMKITHASFGRTSNDYCASKTGPTCEQNVLGIVQTMCDDQTSCVVPASPNTMGFDCEGSNPYLNVTFDCHFPVNKPCDSSCTFVPCPEHASKNGDGSCTCDFGYQNPITWESVAASYTGKCTEAPCPPHAVGNGPTCECPIGYLPSFDWGFVAGSWTGSCVKQDPPPHTINWPEVICEDKAWFVDNKPIVFRGGVGGAGYIGSCKPWPCPAHAEVDGVCTCKKGFALKYNGELHDAPVWNSTVGRWEHTCEFTDCPSGALNHPNCVCDKGFSGYPKWENNQWTGCEVVPCLESENMVKVTAQTAPWLAEIPKNDCMCMQGCNGDIVFNDLQKWTGSCKLAECPATATCSGSTAVCSKGYSGSVAWYGNSFTANSWNSSCIEIPCPTGANAFPECHCHSGFAGGALSWNGEEWGTCTVVACPANTLRTSFGGCICDSGYEGTITWDETKEVFLGSCSVVPCVDNASGGPECECNRGYTPTADYHFSLAKHKWIGSCQPARCPDNSELPAVNCTCMAGFKGTLSWNPDDFKFEGACTAIPCPPHASGDACFCDAGFMGIPTWSGVAWTHQCTRVGCPENTVEVALPGGGYSCKCATLYRGQPSWASSEWLSDCTLVDCPDFSKRSPTTLADCDCDAGYKGYPVWNDQTMAYDSGCTRIQCPAPATGPGGPAGCVCPVGYSGDCTLNTDTQEFDCTCKMERCPSHAHIPAGTTLCECDMGYFGELTWNDVVDKYEGVCNKRECVANSEDHPDCACSKGYSGTVAWDKEASDYTGSCTYVPCPAFTENHPSCTPAKGYRYVGGMEITWETTQWKGLAEAIPCPAHAGTNPPNCDCQQGYTPNGLIVRGQEWVGECAVQPCLSGHPGFPNCNCKPFYEGDFTWHKDTHTWTTTCQVAKCPEHASGPPCKCDVGYKGTLEWNAEKQTWDGACERVFCPPYAENHPACECMSGYTGDIVWKEDTREYVGDCDMVPCPASSRRSGGMSDATPAEYATTSQISKSGVYRVKWANGDFNVHILVSSDRRHKLVKVAQWAEEYTPTPNAFGSVATADPGTGKLSDAQINFLTNADGKRTYRFNWDNSQKEGNYNMLFVKTDLPHQDTRKSFGIVGPNTKAALARSPPADSATSWTSFTTDHIDASQTEPSQLALEESCHRFMMGGTDNDCKGTPGVRCAVGGDFCNALEYPRLANVQVHVALQKEVMLFPISDSADMKTVTVTDSTTTEQYTTPIASCDCFVGFSGGFDWVRTDYVGSCTKAQCPATADCSALEDAPSTDNTMFGCTKGYEGRITWDGDKWVDGCKRVDCPAEGTGHPNCVCLAGYRGSIAYHSEWDTRLKRTDTEYTESCEFVACPQASMVRANSNSGLVTCTCPTGFSGKAVWNPTKQAFDGAQACVEVACPDPTMMSKVDAGALCKCPVGFRGGAQWVAITQVYDGTSTCTRMACPLGATCDDNPTTRDCNQYYAGKYWWDDESQVWANNCSVVACPPHSKAKSAATPSGCTCSQGFSPAATWLTHSQSYAGCSADADCPTGADESVTNSTTNSRMCPCKAGWKGTPLWNDIEARYVHTCTQTECPLGSKRGINALCDCAIGYSGRLDWSVVHQKYLGSCTAAQCNSAAGVNCTYAEDFVHRPQEAQLACRRGYYGSATWNYTNQEWVNNCVLRHCPEHSVRLAEDECSCRWGFGGAVTWVLSSQDYVSTCAVVKCPSPSIDSGDGHCICPAGTEHGTVLFKFDDQWHVNCGRVAPCIEHSSGDVECACNQGYRGSPEKVVSVRAKDEQEITFIEHTTNRTGACVPQACPAFTVEGSFPNCTCASGYSGTVNWTAAQSWDSHCALVECPAHSAGAPACQCDRGYLGVLTFDMVTQKWEGTCQLATCPVNATHQGAECECKNGFSGVPTWSPTKGWTFTCTYVPCPIFAAKVQEGVEVSYQQISKFVGCHDSAGKPLGAIGHPKDFLPKDADECKTSGSLESCVAFAKRACEAALDAGVECWGFAVAPATHSATLYNSRASDYVTCDADNGLKAHPDWTTYRRRVSAGDCQCLNGYRGGYSFATSMYVGSCSKVECPLHSSCNTSVVCDKGYSGAHDFKWDVDQEEWVGTCSPVACGPNDVAASFPDCQCSLGYAGGLHGWDYDKETYTGECTKVDCVPHSEPFPYCRCTTGFIRSDDVPNRNLTWSGAEWEQSCKEVPCPENSHKVAGGNCACNTGFQGTVSFEPLLGSFKVSRGSDDMKSCKRIACPANSAEETVMDPEGKPVPVCKCFTGYVGDMTWNPLTFAWGKCSQIQCPEHSSGHPHCTCDTGYEGSLTWSGSKYTGSCSAQDTTPNWKTLGNDDMDSPICHTIRGDATKTMGTPASAGSIDYLFAGGAASDNVVRCDVKLKVEFTKIRGSFKVTPNAKTTVVNNEMIGSWNSSITATGGGYIAVGTPFHVVDPGNEHGTAKNAFYGTPVTIAVVETAVTQTDTVRFEVHQPSGVELTISELVLDAYTVPEDVVKCVRTTDVTP